jgi:MFS family permease
MVRKTVDCVLEETSPLSVVKVSENRALSETVVPTPPLSIPKKSVRTTLRASTLDGVFATIFGIVTTGVLLTNFLLELGATSVEIGLLSSIPMFVNLLQPLGAYLSERTTSRHWYGILVFGSSRFLWVILLLLIAGVSDFQTERHQLLMWTLGIVLVTHILGSLGSASWFSWMAALVPRRLRGRYFGVRNSAANLVNLICVPLIGWGVSTWKGGAIQGYGIVLFLGIVAGLLSLAFQFFMIDVNPQAVSRECKAVALGDSAEPAPKWFKDTNFLIFLLYFGTWTFAVNLSTPFYSLYMLDNLHLDVSLVTLYSSLMAGANLLMLMMWGKLADRIGNQPILLSVGILVGVTPLFWLATGDNSASVWILIPLVHVLRGCTWAAIDLCSHNIQMSVAPTRNPAAYFAIAAAITGITGALGTTTGGFLAQLPSIGGLAGLFVISTVLRLLALLPLVFVREHRSVSLIDMWRETKLAFGTSLNLFRQKESAVRFNPQAILIQAVGLANRLK